LHRIATFFVTKVWEASVLISLVGICWAVASWVPFSLLMEVRQSSQAPDLLILH